MRAEDEVLYMKKGRAEDEVFWKMVSFFRFLNGWLGYGQKDRPKGNLSDSQLKFVSQEKLLGESMSSFNLSSGGVF